MALGTIYFTDPLDFCRRTLVQADSVSTRGVKRQGRHRGLPEAAVRS